MRGAILRIAPVRARPVRERKLQAEIVASPNKSAELDVVTNDPRREREQRIPREAHQRLPPRAHLVPDSGHANSAASPARPNRQQGGRHQQRRAPRQAVAHRRERPGIRRPTSRYPQSTSRITASAANGPSQSPFNSVSNAPIYTALASPATHAVPSPSPNASASSTSSPARALDTRTPGLLHRLARVAIAEQRETPCRSASDRAAPRARWARGHRHVGLPICPGPREGCGHGAISNRSCVWYSPVPKRIAQAENQRQRETE